METGLNQVFSLFVCQRVDLSLKNSTPWLVMSGSGGVADLLSDIFEVQSPASARDEVVRVTELVKKHFPSEALTDQLVEQVRAVLQFRIKNEGIYQIWSDSQ